ncbi:MAG TPA: hypothetical protein VLM38_21610 [Blastocatellia bacterium]|nr:hypothetical protein [Blastocatellia bacterium]
MTDSSTSLGAVFSIPGHGGDVRSHSQWKVFQDTLGRELKSVKTASMTDVAPKIGELFDIQIPDILVSGWMKAAEVRTIQDKSRAAPDETFWAGLGEHTMSSEHHPYVDIRIEGQTVKRIELTMRLSFKLNSFVLKIQRGEIREIQTGTCEVKGIVEYQGIAIAEKQLAPIQLPGVLVLQ